MPNFQCPLIVKVLVWLVEVYGCESWTFQAGDEKRLQAFEVQGLGQILRVMDRKAHERLGTE